MKVFSEVFVNSSNAHLRNFYAIIPALTISHVEAMLVAKDRMFKQGKECYFTSDGFAIGLAYILKILDQVSICIFHHLNMFGENKLLKLWIP